MLSQGAITCFLSRRLRVDVVNDLMMFLLPVVADLTHLLLQRKPSPKLPTMMILNSSLPRPLPFLREDVTSTLWPVDLYALSVRDHSRFQVLAIALSLIVRCTCHGVSMQQHLKLHCAPRVGVIVTWKHFYQIVQCFKYADNELPGISLLKVRSRLKKSI